MFRGDVLKECQQLHDVIYRDYDTGVDIFPWGTMNC
uniref:Uncharacterized protein n=1 Tax=Bartonella rochalimae ATCC BAA-1498 TaxID=685782 RepID=E6YM14_9HYPH|nr:hypothetical protein BARRO_50265 [Bartonella rochalimae ATCC BAA-1498]